jgi:hypothetical protein
MALCCLLVRGLSPGWHGYSRQTLLLDPLWKKGSKGLSVSEVGWVHSKYLALFWSVILSFIVAIWPCRPSYSMSAILPFPAIVNFLYLSSPLWAISPLQVIVNSRHLCLSGQPSCFTCYCKLLSSVPLWSAILSRTLSPSGPFLSSCLYLFLYTPSIWSFLVSVSHLAFNCYCTLPPSVLLLSVSAILPLPVIVHSRHLFFCCQPSCNTSRPRHGFLK